LALAYFRSLRVSHSNMKAILCTGKGGVETLSETTLPEPELRDNDVLVELKAAAVNPVDCKNREHALAGDQPRVLGYDGSGVVKKLGSAVTCLKVGDEVMFSGDLTRNGTFAEQIAVDARICGRKPKSMDWVSSAAVPLVSITAWELLFENLRLPTDGSGKDMVFMMYNGAGGVGSVAIQLAKHVLGATTIVATASRPETEEWCKKMGATHVISHYKDLDEELKRVGFDPEGIDVCFCGVDLDLAFDKIAKVMRPGGCIGSITVADATKIDVSKLFFPKRLTLSFEFMFARPMLNVKPEMQGALLSKVADLIDAGKFVDPTVTKYQGLTLDNVKESQKLQDSGKAMGKIAIGF